MYVCNKSVQRGKTGVNGQRARQSVISAYQHEGVYAVEFSVPVILFIYVTGNWQIFRKFFHRKLLH